MELEAYLKPIQTSGMEFFYEIVHGFYLSVYILSFAYRTVLDTVLLLDITDLRNQLSRMRKVKKKGLFQ